MGGWKPFSTLSGGQQALAALSLNMAIQQCYHSPFYFLDEVDAALGTVCSCTMSDVPTDRLNCERVAQYLRHQAAHHIAQFIVISQRPQMYECAPRIIGTYTHAHTSRTVAQSFGNV